jgi:hypothetical protein
VPVDGVTGGLVAAIAVCAPVGRAPALLDLVEQLHACAERLRPLVS